MLAWGPLAAGRARVPVLMLCLPVLDVTLNSPTTLHINMSYRESLLKGSLCQGCRTEDGETVLALKEYTGWLDQEDRCLKIVNRMALDKGPSKWSTQLLEEGQASLRGSGTGFKREEGKGMRSRGENSLFLSAHWFPLSMETKHQNPT